MGHVGDVKKRSFNDWLPWLAGGLAILAMVGFMALIAGVIWAQNQQMSALVTRIEASEAAMMSVQESVAKSYAEHGTDPTALDASLQEDAKAGIASIGKASHDIMAYQPLPLDPKMIEAKQAYLKHTAAWLAYLNAAAKDPAQFEADQPDVDNTFRAFEKKLRDAVPPIALGDLKARIDAIFTNGNPPADSGTTQGVALTASFSG